MSWLWIDHPRFTVRVEMDENQIIKTLPSILYKKFNQYIGQHYTVFEDAIHNAYKNKAHIVLYEE